MKNSKITALITSFLILIILVSGCNRPNSASEANTTLDVTQAYQTVEARMTESAGLTPSPPDTNPTTTQPIVTTTEIINNATATNQPIQPTNTQPPVKKCDQAAAGTPIDVTIPDDTKMQPGESFTKTWRLQNVGTCTWTKDYSIAVFSGESMNAPVSVSMPAKVEPGTSVDISVDLIAPQEAGTYQGNWKLRNAANEWFGIGPSGDSAFWVRIVVSQSATETITPTVSEVPTETTPTNTSTPGVKVSGTAALIPSDNLNLDNNTVNTGSGEDLSYISDTQNNLFLAPTGGARFSVYGDSTPDFNACQAANLNDSALALDNLYNGLHICYVTGKGRYGYIRLLNFDANTLNLSLQINTWSN
jgi:hypothetical protein